MFFFFFFFCESVYFLRYCKLFGQACLVVEKMWFLENEGRKKKESWVRVLGF